MWKIILVLLALLFVSSVQAKEFNIEDLLDYQKQFTYYNVGVCSPSSTKTYMDYRAVTDPSSRQYWFIRNNMTVDPDTGFLYDKDGFIGVATGSRYGIIGDRFYFTLSNGIVLPVVKIDEKSDAHTVNGCYHANDGSVLEFVVHTGYARNLVGQGGNGLLSSGNYNNYPLFRGNIVKVEKASYEKRSDIVEYHNKNEINEVKMIKEEQNIFQYASGY